MQAALIHEMSKRQTDEDRQRNVAGILRDAEQASFPRLRAPPVYIGPDCFQDFLDKMKALRRGLSADFEFFQAGVGSADYSPEQIDAVARTLVAKHREPDAGDIHALTEARARFQTAFKAHSAAAVRHTTTLERKYRIAGLLTKAKRAAVGTATHERETEESLAKATTANTEAARELRETEAALERTRQAHAQNKQAVVDTATRERRIEGSLAKATTTHTDAARTMTDAVRELREAEAALDHTRQAAEAAAKRARRD
jgi:hypothetical protein